MQMNGNSIRIREIDIKELAWESFVDWERERQTVPCFIGAKTKFPYSAFLKPSLDLLHFRELCEERRRSCGEKHIFKRREVEYTDAFIQINTGGIDKIMTTWDGDEISIGYLYEYGVYEQHDWNEYVRYVPYKRSANAAKKGKYIFIREEFYEDMMDWTWLGKAPKDLQVSLPYVEMKAYEALVNSNIKRTVTIAPEEILLLDDVKNTFRTKIAKVIEEDGEFSLSRCEEDVTNNVFDGECLIDTSVFEAAGMDDGMMLLRNFFFKSCGFRTDIQGYYREYFGKDYESAWVRDKYGNRVEVKNIKMIVTTSSFKVFKFKEYFAYRSKYEKNDWQWEPTEEQLEDAQYYSFDNEGFTYDLWCTKVKESGCLFGVVKNEEANKPVRKFTYQMLNSMNFSEEDIDGLLSEDIARLVELRTDYEAYETYVGGGKVSGRKENISDTEFFVIDLAQKNPIFRQTNLYKGKRANDIRAFKQRLYEGKLTIEADYHTLCSMPWELLQYSIKREDAFSNPVLKKGEIYIPGLQEGEELTLCRNPHTCASNVVWATNHVVPEMEKWFRFRRENGSSNIVVISPWEWDVMEALNGADFDSDEVLCIKDKTVLKRAKELGENEQIAAIPHAQIASDRRGTIRMENFLEQYDMDKSLAGNKIGIISNYAQILNGYYWDSYYEDSRFAECREALYDDIQILSVLMGLEIDKAKHAYAFDAEKVATEIVNKYMLLDIFAKTRLKKPIYIYFIDKNKHGKAVERAEENGWLRCPMDYVAKRLYQLYKTEEQLINREQVSTVSLEDVFDVKDYKGYNAHKVEAVLDKICECIRMLKPLNINKEDLDWLENSALKESLLNDTYSLMEKNKISIKEMKRILYLLLEIEVTDKMKRKKKAQTFYECLLVNNKEVVGEILHETEPPKTLSRKFCEVCTEYIEQAKKRGEKKQINYAKCNKLFEKFLKINIRKNEEKQGFASELKKEKNLLNIAYMLQIITGARSYAAAKNDKLIALSMLYHVWPEIFMECVKMQKTDLKNSGNY